MNLRTVAIMALLLLLAGASHAQDKVKDRGVVVERAREYLTKTLPADSDIFKYETLVVERPDAWIVTYKPKGQQITGGAPEIHFDKTSLRITETRWAQ